MPFSLAIPPITLASNLRDGGLIAPLNLGRREVVLIRPLWALTLGVLPFTHTAGERALYSHSSTINRNRAPVCQSTR